MKAIGLALLSCLLCHIAAAARLDIEQGQSQLIDRAGVSEIIVANGEIAAVRHINDQLALLMAKAVGQTELYFLQGQKVNPAVVKVYAPGTRFGALWLRLMILEQHADSAESGGLDLGVQVNGQANNGQSSISAQGLLDWIPNAKQAGVELRAQPRIRIEPGQPVHFSMGGEVARAGADGSTEDKAYGLELDAQFHWEGSEIAFTQQISLSTPAGDGSYRKQTLEQSAQVPLAEVIEFARFDGLESDQLKQQRGLPFGRKQTLERRRHWRVIGWFEPIEDDG